MTNLPATREQQDLTQREFSPAQLTLLKNTLAKGTSDEEFRLFLAVCKRTDLDPFKREIYAIMRRPKAGEDPVMVIQTGIDGFRKITSKGGDYAGVDEPEYGPEIGGYPEWARVTVYRIVKGVRCSFVGVARWKEFAVDPTGPNGMMWRKMPYQMLGKCAEAQAHRKASPQAIAGIEFEANENVIEVRTGELLEPANPQTRSERRPEPARATVEAASPYPDDSVMVVCPCGVRWPAEKLDNYGNVTCSHPTGEKNAEGKTIFHRRNNVLGDLLKAAVAASGLSAAEATDLVKDRFGGLTTSKLSDAQRYEAIGLFSPMAEEIPMPAEETPPAGPYGP